MGVIICIINKYYVKYLTPKQRHINCIENLVMRLLSEGPKPFKQLIVDSSVVVWVQPRQFERATVENEREWSPQIAFVSPSQPRVIKPRARAMDKVAEPPLTTLLHLLSPSVALLA